MKLNYKILSILIAIGAVSGITSAAKAQYYPSTGSSYDYDQSYQDYQQRMNESEQRHKQILDTIWY